MSPSPSPATFGLGRSPIDVHLSAVPVETVDIILPLEDSESESARRSAAAAKLGVATDRISETKLRKHSIDARQRAVKVQLRLDVALDEAFPPEAPPEWTCPPLPAGAKSVVIVGCGRVGSSIAKKMLAEGHEVSVLDEDPEAIAQLEKGSAQTWEELGGSFTVGTALEIDALLEAGIDRADAFVASTDGDNTNLVIAQVAKRRFEVERVVVRVLDPARARWYAEQGLQTVCPTQTAIELLEAAVRGQIRFEGVAG